jgi:hypothetical protein
LWVSDERDCVGDRLQSPTQTQAGSGLGGGAAPESARGRDAVGGAGEVEQVRAFGLVELQRAGKGLQNAGRRAGDLAALEPCVIFHAQSGDGGDLAAPEAGDTAAARRRQANLLGS